MKKVIKKIWYIISFQWFVDAMNEAVDAGVCDFSGEGRDKYGK